MSRLDLNYLCLRFFEGLRVLAWVSLILFLGTQAAKANTVPESPGIGSLGTCAIYSNQIRFIEPSKDILLKPLSDLPPDKSFYGCTLNIWEIDELGNMIGSSVLIVKQASSPAGGGIVLVDVPIQFTGKLVRVSASCSNAYGSGPVSKTITYFVKGK